MTLSMQDRLTHWSRRTFLNTVCGVAASASLPAFAQSVGSSMEVKVFGGAGNRFPISIADFEGEGAYARALVSVIRNDLDHCGLFQLVENGPVPVDETTRPDFGRLKERHADYFTGGSLRATGNRMEARFQLWDVVNQKSLEGFAYLTDSSSLRMAAHRISDYIYEKVTGVPGYFSSRIAFVTRAGNRYSLQVADSDGQNAQIALNSFEPIISPAWSPEGGRLAYVSFEAKKPVIYVHTLATGRREIVANFKGSNSAPAWSPDGRRLAVVLTKDGGSQLFAVGVDNHAAARLHSSSGIDTEPQYSPDGQWIYFTSDRGGSPQIYRIPASGGDAQRITVEGSYNVTPRLTPDGKTLVYISRREGRFQVTTMDLASRQVLPLTDSNRDESPSVAPNGRMILFATEVGGRGVLSAVSTDGKVKQRLSVSAGDVREPAWGPTLK